MQNAKNGYILAGTEAFTRGELDNVALAENAVCLEQTAGRYVLYGCYTSPVIAFPPFTELAISWNAETPQGTVVEAQARVLVGRRMERLDELWQVEPVPSRPAPRQPPAALAYLQGDTVHIPRGVRSRRSCAFTFIPTTSARRPVCGCWRPACARRSGARSPPCSYGRLLRLPAHSQQVWTRRCARA